LIQIFKSVDLVRWFKSARVDFELELLLIWGVELVVLLCDGISYIVHFETGVGLLGVKVWEVLVGVIEVFVRFVKSVLKIHIYVLLLGVIGIEFKLLLYFFMNIVLMLYLLFEF
jgi:hypothetical protein